MKELNQMNKELKEERDNVPFNIEEFTNWFYGGADKVKEKRFLGINTQHDPLKRFISQLLI